MIRAATATSGPSRKNRTRNAKHIVCCRVACASRRVPVRRDGCRGAALALTETGRRDLSVELLCVGAVLRSASERTRRDLKGVRVLPVGLVPIGVLLRVADGTREMR